MSISKCKIAFLIFAVFSPLTPACPLNPYPPPPAAPTSPTRSAENSKKTAPANRGSYEIFICFSSPDQPARTREGRSDTPAHKPHLHRLSSRFPLVLLPCGNGLHFFPHFLYSGFYGLASAFIIFIAGTPTRITSN